ncbi:MAG: Brp/Blh family beta-carotene 15,15'-dioxygenase [Methylophilaceae bacterium]
MRQSRGYDGKIMHQWIKTQSNLFIIASIALIVIAHGQDISQSLALFFGLILLVIIFGVPHGSLDVLFANQHYQLNDIKKWLTFIGLYSLTAFIIILIWKLVPSLLFIAFLILSALHFADDISSMSDRYQAVPRWENLIKKLYGFSLIAAPSWLFAPQLSSLYAMIVDESSAANIVAILQWLCVPLILVTISLSVICKMQYRSLLEIITAFLLIILLHPILAFTIYFCLMHSARHLIRSQFFLKHYSQRDYLLALTLPTLAVIVFGLMAWHFLPHQSLQSDIVKIVFVGLAALTVPHAWLLNSARFYQLLRFHR